MFPKEWLRQHWKICREIWYNIWSIKRGQNIAKLSLILMAWVQNKKKPKLDQTIDEMIGQQTYSELTWDDLKVEFGDYNLTNCKIQSRY